MVEIAVRLLSGTQSGRIGNSSRKDSGHRRDRNSRHEMQRHSHAHTYKYDEQHQHIERQTSTAERSEKAGPHLQTDRINEENKAELLQKMEQMFIKIKINMAKYQPNEQDPCESE